MVPQNVPHLQPLLLRELEKWLHSRAGAVGGHAGPVQHADRASAFEGESVSVTGGLAGPYGLGQATWAATTANCTDVFTTGVDVVALTYITKLEAGQRDVVGPSR